MSDPWEPNFSMNYVVTRRTDSQPGRRSTWIPLSGEERAQIEQAKKKLAQCEILVARLEAELAETRIARTTAEDERNALRSSLAWRATRPFRAIMAVIPVSSRNAVRRFLRAGYWLLTLRPTLPIVEGRGPSPELPITMPEPAPEKLPAGRDYGRWVRDYDSLVDDDRAAIRAHLSRLAYQPLISIVLPIDKASEKFLREAIASVERQLYVHWELCIADHASTSEAVRNVLLEAAAKDDRIKWTGRDGDGSISAATTAAMGRAIGDFVATVDPNGLLSEHSLYEIVVELNDRPNADLIYTDEDEVDDSGRRHTPYFKPDWNIELQLGHNMVGHLGVYRRSLLEQVSQQSGEGRQGSWTDDLALRVAAVSTPAQIRHIPAVLYHQHRIDTSCVSATPHWTQVRSQLPNPAPRVSILVPTRDNAELLARCVAGLLHRTDYADIELLIVDNDSSDPAAIALLDRLRADRRVRILPFPGVFNYAAINNMAVREATGEIVVLVNDDIDVICGGWLGEMVALAIRPDIGAVGAKLFYGDGRIQHAGVILGVGEHSGRGGIAGHFGHGANGDDPGYFGQYMLTRELSAVTAACMALRREVYLAVGGLDAENLPISYNDVDLCLRIRAMGLRILWTPVAELYHLESSSRGRDVTPEQRARAAREAGYMRDRWNSELNHDPFYNPNFDWLDPMKRLAEPPRRIKPWRR